jgi:hypothetical protein
MNLSEPLGSIVLSRVDLFIDWCSRAIRSCKGSKAIESPTSTGAAQQIVRAASASQDQSTDGAPESVTIDLGDDTLVITLHEVFSPAQRTPKDGTDDAQMQEIYRQFIADALASLRQHMKRLADESVPKAAQVSRVRGRSPSGWDSGDPASSKDQRPKRFARSATSDVR